MIDAAHVLQGSVVSLLLALFCPAAGSVSQGELSGHSHLNVYFIAVFSVVVSQSGPFDSGVIKYLLSFALLECDTANPFIR